MLSIASFMSTTSNANINTNNPYINSNVIFEKKLNSFLHKSNESNSISELINTRSEEGSSSGGGGYKFNFTDEEIPDEDNIDFYLKLHAKQSETNKDFDSISQVFKSSTNINQINENNFSIENAIENDMKIIKVKNKSIDSNNNTITSNNNKNKSVPNSSSSSSLNSKNQTIKLNEQKTVSSSSLNKKTSNQNQNETLIETKNPFLNEKEEENDKNPFLDEKEDKNPFLIDKKNEETINPKSKNESTQNNVSTILNASKDSISNSLLDWCNEKIRTTQSNSLLFKKLIVNDFSTSWMNGLAFCAILYNFSPNLIDLNSLDVNDCRKNLKQAFNASDKESIMRVVDISDFTNRKKIDELSIMTYLYQIKNHFDNKKQPAPQRPTSILSDDNTSKVFAAKLATLPNLISTPMSNKLPSNNKNQNSSLKSEKTPVKSISGSSTNNPFESDVEEENVNNTNNPNSNKKKSGLIEIKSNGKIVDACLAHNFNEPFCDDILDNIHSRRSTSRRNSLHSRSGSSSSTSSINSANHHNNLVMREKKSVNESSNQSNNQKVTTPNKSEELIERAKQLIEKTKNESENSAAKREEIKQLAKQMIADTKKKRKSSIPNSMTKNYPAPKPPIDSNNHSSNNSQEHNSNNNNNNKSDDLNTTNDIVNNIQQSLDEQTQTQLIGTEYINQEIINLRNKQLELDEQGANLEKQLRILMKDKKSDQDKELEDILLKKWFLLINEKNKLIYQQQELETL